MNNYLFDVLNKKYTGGPPVYSSPSVVRKPLLPCGIVKAALIGGYWIEPVLLPLRTALTVEILGPVN